MLPKLTVDFQGNFRVTYTSHVDFNCWTINNCPHWDLAASISWEDLPTNKFAIFYETDTCRTGAKYFYISDVAKVDGSHTFDTPQIIRSYMIGSNNNYTRRPAQIISTCTEERARIGDAGGDAHSETTSDKIKWSSDGSSVAGACRRSHNDVHESKDLDVPEIQQLLVLARHQYRLLEEPRFKAVRHLYESDKCSTDQDYYFVLDLANPAGGEYTFKKHQVFRSMALGKYKDEPTFTYVNNCPSDKESAVANDTSVYLTWGSDDGSRSDGGLSSSWNDTL